LRAAGEPPPQLAAANHMIAASNRSEATRLLLHCSSVGGQLVKVIACGMFNLRISYVLIQSAESATIDVIGFPSIFICCMH